MLSTFKNSKAAVLLCACEIMPILQLPEPYNPECHALVPSKRVSPCEASQQCVGPKDTKQPKRQYPANSTQTLGFAWVPHALSRRVGANHLIITSTWNSVLTSQH